MKNTHTNKSIKELGEEIKALKKSLDCTINMNEILEKSYNEADKQRLNYRKIIKYHTLLLVVMNLLCNTEEKDDVTRIIRNSILEYYKRINQDMLEIPTCDDEYEYEEENAEEVDEEFGEEEF